MLATATQVDVANHDTLPIAQTIPKFSVKSDERKWLLREMAGAFRLCARRGYGIGSAGLISVRDPENTNTFWLNPLGQHFATLKASDMVLVDFDGNVVGGSKRRVNRKVFEIHRAIHRARPDVVSVCQFHSVYGKTYSAFGRPLEMLSQDACLFYNDQVVCDFGGKIGKESAAEIAKALSTKRSMILQNCGLLTVGGSVGEAMGLYLLMEQTCEAQLAADVSSVPKRLVSDEAAEFTFKAMAYPESLWFEFVCDLEYEEFLDPSYKD